MLEDFFENYFKIEKAYRKYFQDEMEKYHLTPNELLVLLFLARDNGGCNTARDIAQYEGVSKGLVARSVESLVEKQFLVVERDAADKRICHLYLTQCAHRADDGEKSCVFPQAGRRYSGGSDCDDGTDTAQVYGKYIRIY